MDEELRPEVVVAVRVDEDIAKLLSREFTVLVNRGNRLVLRDIRYLLVVRLKDAAVEDRIKIHVLIDVDPDLFVREADVVHRILDVDDCLPLEARAIRALDASVHINGFLGCVLVNHEQAVLVDLDVLRLLRVDTPGHGMAGKVALRNDLGRQLNLGARIYLLAVRSDREVNDILGSFANNDLDDCADRRVAVERVHEADPYPLTASCQSGDTAILVNGQRAIVLLKRPRLRLNELKRDAVLRIRNKLRLDDDSLKLRFVADMLDRDRAFGFLMLYVGNDLDFLDDALDEHRGNRFVGPAIVHDDLGLDFGLAALNRIDHADICLIDFDRADRLIHGFVLDPVFVSARVRRIRCRDEVCALRLPKLDVVIGNDDAVRALLYGHEALGLKSVVRLRVNNCRGA